MLVHNLKNVKHSFAFIFGVNLWLKWIDCGRQKTCLLTHGKTLTATSFWHFVDNVTDYLLKLDFVFFRYYYGNSVVNGSVRTRTAAIFSDSPHCPHCPHSRMTTHKVIHRFDSIMLIVSDH
jgi:hypothetical protein